MRMNYSQPRRAGPSGETRKITPKKPSPLQKHFREPVPCDFNKESKGGINYDPILGWFEPNPLLARGGETAGIDYKHSKNYLRRHDGLPGSRP